MLFSKLIRSEKAVYIYFFFIAFIVALTSTYSPFNFREMHVDSSVYMAISDGMTRGLLPYRDLVDNKGPLLYLINIPGLLLGKFNGVWITELLFFYISILFAYKTALFFGGKYKALFGTFLSFIMLLAFSVVNAGTEEYSLPFLMISFYIFTKHYFSEKNKIRFVELIVLGICFACAVIIRLNMFPLWAGFCLVIIAESIVKKQFLQLGKYIAGFLLGIIIATAPLFLYLNINGIFDEFIYQVIYGGASRGFNGVSLKNVIYNYYDKVNKTYSFVPLIWGFYWIIKKFPRGNYVYHIGYILSYILMILFFSFNDLGIHYNLVLIPYTIPPFVFFINIVHSSFTSAKNKSTICFFLALLIMTNEAVGRNIWVAYKRIFIQDSGIHLFNTGKMIDENTSPEDGIISLGFNGYIYPFTERKAVSKYIYQGSGLNHISGAREEFISDILTAKPAMIIVYTGFEGTEQYIHDWHEPIYKMMESEYHFFSKNVCFNLYKRNE